MLYCRFHLCPWGRGMLPPGGHLPGRWGAECLLLRDVRERCLSITLVDRRNQRRQHTPAEADATMPPQRGVVSIAAHWIQSDHRVSRGRQLSSPVRVVTVRLRLAAIL